MNAVVNWTKSIKSDGTPLPGIPALMGTSLQVRRAHLAMLAWLTLAAYSW